MPAGLAGGRPHHGLPVRKPTLRSAGQDRQIRTTDLVPDTASAGGRLIPVSAGLVHRMSADALALIAMDDRLDTPYELAPMIYLPLITIFRHSTDGHGVSAGSRPDRRECARSP